MRSWEIALIACRGHCISALKETSFICGCAHCGSWCCEGTVPKKIANFHITFRTETLAQLCIVNWATVLFLRKHMQAQCTK